MRWLEEAIILNDINGYYELRRFGTTPIAAGEHEFTSYSFRQMIEAKALDYFQFDTNASAASPPRARSRRWPRPIRSRPPCSV